MICASRAILGITEAFYGPKVSHLMRRCSLVLSERKQWRYLWTNYPWKFWEIIFEVPWKDSWPCIETKVKRFWKCFRLFMLPDVFKCWPSNYSSLVHAGKFRQVSVMVDSSSKVCEWKPILWHSSNEIIGSGKFDDDRCVYLSYMAWLHAYCVAIMSFNIVQTSTHVQKLSEQDTLLRYDKAASSSLAITKTN